MTKEQKILEILNSKPTQKIGLDDFYGRQTVTNMLKEAINYTHCCTEVCVCEFERIDSKRIQCIKCEMIQSRR